MQQQVTWAEPVPFLQPQLKKPPMMLPRSPFLPPPAAVRSMNMGLLSLLTGR
ncbi:hypothetical protein MYCTH_2302869 [Thermothelomyces thermophilus ATCC 42464]|uniref:Uncharacterized protein n=1 Tax=Thermothelomyces thermophilus (strain ATCC 42464 / BCRC 31852 / DSM 1799) TaxID=573729 RepID=G2Q8P1_THET4|nr:uncharacterized protein MYCTH_2302869 [Thermothelomyces thermophilus ATCC 42464]AEO57090.1 hypothetical protein MYCTH_2302869 [Thermothelomyces thermophilus ATCC 42464]